ncbi:MAG TPA: antibiotic biosynthesis monooxygenase [Candidatus Limnocylindrales bacterium]|nr:antibiotic biosynthesis monooxygenase [Candidatus Limnocylindrales bacterium]
MLVVVAKIKAKADAADEVARLFESYVAWVKDNEASTITYSCNRSRKDPTEFLFFERYSDEAAMHAHSSSSRFAEMVGGLAGKLDGTMDVVMFDEVAAKF